MPEAYVLREGLTPEIVKELQNCCPYEENNHEGVEKASDVYADYFLARRVTALERMEALKKLSEKQEVWLFSDCEELSLTEVRQMGRVDYYNQMPQVFEASKINLNITLRSIQTGIPPRVLDIMGCRGFLITNYQQEMEEYFTRGIHYEDYRSIEELEEKTAYYLRHDVERERIAEHGYERVKEEFCYRKRLQQIEKIVRG